jgi:hypothetical protein
MWQSLGIIVHYFKVLFFYFKFQFCYQKVGHPYLDVIDNGTDFITKVNRVLRAVCERISLDSKGFDYGLEFDIRNKKRKWLVKSLPPGNPSFHFQDFNVVVITEKNEFNLFSNFKQTLSPF